MKYENRLFIGGPAHLKWNAVDTHAYGWVVAAYDPDPLWLYADIRPSTKSSFKKYHYSPQQYRYTTFIGVDRFSLEEVYAERNAKIMLCEDSNLSDVRSQDIDAALQKADRVFYSQPMRSGIPCPSRN